MPAASKDANRASHKKLSAMEKIISTTNRYLALRVVLTFIFAASAEMALAASVNVHWQSLDDIAWRGGMMENDTLILKPNYWSRKGVVVVDSVSGQWIDMQVESSTKDIPLFLYGGETLNGDRFTTKVMQSLPCLASDVGMRCNLRVFVANGKKSLLLQITNRDLQPVVLKGVQVRSWQAPGSQRPVEAANLNKALAWMQDIYWKTRDVQWDFLKAQARQALYTPCLRPVYRCPLVCHRNGWWTARP